MKDCSDKELKLNDMEYQDIIDKYGIKMHYDSLRKSQQTPFGAVAATQYLSMKNGRSYSLSDAREVLGEQYIVKQQIHNDRLKLNKLKRELRLSIIDTEHTDKEIRLDINGLKCKFVHGDDTPKIDNNSMARLISSDNEFYNLVCYGHWHNFSCRSENNGRYVVTNGCLSGRNTYSKSFLCSTDASQTIIIVGDGEVELLKDVNLA